MDNPRGSLWHRWDPHIHMPGTILNDQYRGEEPWEQFLVKVEQSDPTISVLGITDYLSLDIYERILEEKNRGRLPSVGLIFPNVEMRFGIATASNSAINFHLLISPEDPRHITEARRFLLSLTFPHNGDEYRCERSDLIRLGRVFDTSAADDHVALRVGTTQFKVNHVQLRENFNKNDWAKANILIAVAGSSRDGTAGMQENASFTALRQGLERDAHIIFSSQPNQRKFWLGKGTLGAAELTTIFGGVKPCLHGSDAHDHATVGNPALNRFCWIKGDLTFESLRQACLEPENRTFIGAEPPRHAMPSQIISTLIVSGASWLGKEQVELNPGLVAIIGARGSGKTALADLIAVGAFALSPQLNERSFIHRASKLLGDVKAQLTWEDGRVTENEIKHVELEEILDDAHVQYLSQQFVDQLCSSEGLTDSLVAEIERVIFQSHSPEGRMGATSFAELRDIRTSTLRNTRAQEEAVIADASDSLIAEQAKKDSLADLKVQRQTKLTGIASDKRDRQSLVGKGQADRGEELERVSDALNKVRGQVDAWTRRHQQLIGLQNEVVAMRRTGAPAILRKQQDTYPETGLSQEQWQAFLLNHSGDVDLILTERIANAVSQASAWRGPAIGEVTPPSAAPPQSNSLIASGEDLTQQTTTLLTAEAARLRSLIGIDAENTRKYTRLTGKISNEEIALSKLNREIEAAEKAGERIAELIKIRQDAYRDVFSAIKNEEQELSVLYRPLQHILQTEVGALGKLGFSIRRIVDVDRWTRAGEDLMDLRTSGPFRGKGSLLAALHEKGLSTAWESGTVEDATAAMAAFRTQYAPRFIEHCPVDKQDRAALREWIAKVSDWLYGTDHIIVSYGVQYEGVDIEQLSPGTRGIVLLLLYLSIDTEDDRPLIIDQPEENLDPQSIFDELVKRFRAAKHRRQIIIVTHNANLVVNTDADQVIVASAGSHRPGHLPRINYDSGGLENPRIRQQVCNILEGGEKAFRERAKRLRVSI